MSEQIRIALTAAFVALLAAGCDSQIHGGELRRMAEDCGGLENIDSIDNEFVSKARCEDGSMSTGKPN